MKIIQFKKPKTKNNASVTKKEAEKESVNIFIRAEKDLVKSARLFARKNHISLSALVENYFRIIHESGKQPSLEMPSTSSIKGIIKGIPFDGSDYYRYLTEKYR